MGIDVWFIWPLKNSPFPGVNSIQLLSLVIGATHLVVPLGVAAFEVADKMHAEIASGRGDGRSLCKV